MRCEFAVCGWGTKPAMLGAVTARAFCDIRVTQKVNSQHPDGELVEYITTSAMLSEAALADSTAATDWLANAEAAKLVIAKNSSDLPNRICKIV